MKYENPFESLLHEPTPAERCRTTVEALLSGGEPVATAALTDEFGVELTADVLRAMAADGLCHVGERDGIPMLMPGAKPEPPAEAPAKTEPKTEPKAPAKAAPKLAVEAPAPQPVANDDLHAIRELLYAAAAGPSALSALTGIRPPVFNAPDEVIRTLVRVVVLLSAYGPCTASELRTAWLTKTHRESLPAAIVHGGRHGVLFVPSPRTRLQLLDPSALVPADILAELVQVQEHRDAQRAAGRAAG